MRGLFLWGHSGLSGLSPALRDSQVMGEQVQLVTGRGDAGRPGPQEKPCRGQGPAPESGRLKGPLQGP